MSWLYAVAIGYLVVCWLGSVLIFLANFSAGDDGGCKAEATYAAFKKKYPVRMRVGVVLAIVLLGPLLPLIIGYSYLTLWRELQMWRRLARTHRELMFEPLHLANMPRAAQHHIELHEPLLHELGFTPQGTYLSKPEPLAIHSKYFLSPDGDCVVEVLLIGGETAYSFTSILEDGHVLETACAEAIACTDAINDTGRFTGDMIERHSTEDCVAELYRRHRQTLRELERQLRCGTYHYAADQVNAVMRYSNDFFGEVQFSIGELDTPPPSPNCPKGFVESLSGQSLAPAGHAAAC